MLSRLKSLIVVLLALSIVQCGGKKSRSNEAALFEVLPKEPIVILGKTKDSKDNDIQGPWFSFRLKLSNNDQSEAITLVAISLEIYLPGETTPKTVVFSASDFNKTVPLTADTFKECKYTAFDSIDAGANDQQLALGFGDADCSGIPVFIVGNLGVKEVGATYRFRVKARPMGWFGDINNPTDRFDMKFSFATK